LPAATLDSMAKTPSLDTEGLERQADAALEEIRPYIHSHGGEVNVLEVTPEGIARIQMWGACGGCPMAMMTLKLGIERLLAEKVPQLTGVEGVLVDDFDWDAE